MEDKDISLSLVWTRTPRWMRARYVHSMSTELRGLKHSFGGTYTIHLRIQRHGNGAPT